MNSFLTFTLVAGVAITSTSLVHAAGAAKNTNAGAKSVSIGQGPVSLANTGASSLDRSAFNRELTRLTDLISGPVGDDLVTEGTSFGRKVGGTFIF